MLKKLILKNFKCSKSFTLDFGEFNLIAGKNNVGKSTVVQALQLIANVTRYAPWRKSITISETDFIPEGTDGFRLLERDIPFSTINIHFNYIEKDAVVIAKFSEGIDIQIVFPYEREPCFFIVRGKYYYDDISTIRRFLRTSMGVLPPVGTFEEDEYRLTIDHVRDSMKTYLASRHFRNIWYHFHDDFDQFSTILSDTWDGVDIEELPESRLERSTGEYKLNMFFKEDRILREIFWAGHGLQVWMQLLTHLIKSSNKSTIILDEPDIFLHSDMQRKLVQLLQNLDSQIIVATHSVDMINEVDPNDIITIDKKLRKSKKLSTVDDVHLCIMDIGSSQNIKIMHFFRSKACLFVEGDDHRILKRIAKIIKKDEFLDYEKFSTIEIDGSANWDRLKNFKWIFENTLGESIKSYLILDRDYKTQNELNRIEKSLKKRGVKTHIWGKKEIENYLFNKKSIFNEVRNRVNIRAKKINKKAPIFSENDVWDLVLASSELLKDNVYSQLLSNELKEGRKLGKDDSTIIKNFKKIFEKFWSDEETRIGLVSGKDLLSKLNSKLMKKWKISITISGILRNMKPDDVHPELVGVIDEILELS